MFKKIMALKNDLVKRGETYVALGLDVINFGRDLIAERLKSQAKSDTEDHGADYLKNIKKKNIEKNFSVPEANDPHELAKQQSMKASRKRTKGSSNPNTNSWHRNFENHQGN